MLETFIIFAPLFVATIASHTSWSAEYIFLIWFWDETWPVRVLDSCSPRNSPKRTPPHVSLLFPSQAHSKEHTLCPPTSRMPHTSAFMDTFVKLSDWICRRYLLPLWSDTRGRQSFNYLCYWFSCPFAVILNSSLCAWNRVLPERDVWHVGNLIDDSKQSIFWLLALDDLTRLFSHTGVWFVFPCSFSLRTPAGVILVAGRGHCSLLLSLFGMFLASVLSFVLVWVHCSLSIFHIQMSLTALASVDWCCDTEMQMLKTCVWTPLNEEKESRMLRDISLILITFKSDAVLGIFSGSSREFSSTNHKQTILTVFIFNTRSIVSVFKHFTNSFLFKKNDLIIDFLSFWLNVFYYIKSWYIIY